jgi:succinate dehydrogenase hydrophobic anchor subunit
MLHGLNGLRYSIEDYVRRPGAQIAVKTVAYVAVLAALSVALFALFTFDPAVFAR